MIEKAIHTQWADVSSLTAVIPAASFTTGSRLDDKDSPLPAAVMELQSTNRDRKNSGATRTHSVRIKAWVRNHSTGVSLRSAMLEAFENTAWTITGFSVIECRIENEFALQEDDGVWQFVFDIELLTT